MSDQPKEEVRTTSGFARLDHKAITAEGKGRSRMVATWFGGIALVLLILIYGYALAYQKDSSRDLLTVIATLFGILIGRYSQHDT